MRFEVYRVSITCYPRCQHAHRILKQLSGRYDDLRKECLFENNIPDSTDMNSGINTDKPTFHLCLQMSDKEHTFQIEDMLKRKEEFQYIDTVECGMANDLIREKKYLNKKFAILVMDENVCYSYNPQNKKFKTILLSETLHDTDETYKCRQDTRGENISSERLYCDEVGDQLEQYLFEAFQMKYKYETLETALNSIRKGNDSKEQIGVYSSQRKLRSQSHTQRQAVTDKDGEYKEASKRDRIQNKRKQKGSISTDLYEDSFDRKSLEYTPACHWRKKIPRLSEEYLCINGSREKYHEYTYEQIERMECLRDEIVGAFTRSHVPKEKQPELDKHFNGTVSEKLKQDLSLLGPCVRSCGYRFHSLQVFVDHECDLEEMKPQVEKVLKKHNISIFSIVPTRVKELTTCKVGSKVQAKFDDGAVKGGTLGGFGIASSDKGENTICFISRHVVTDVNSNPASEVNILCDGKVTNTSIMVDRTFSSDRETILDIAAVSLIGSNVSMDTRYKTSVKMEAKGRPNSYSSEQMKGLPVHICGSSTPIGYGTVTMPRIEGVRDKGMDDFIIIEDAEIPHQGKIQFCKKGDSGAIVCTDDQENPESVQLISMLIGENIEKPGTYFSLDLGKGITQVEEETKSKVELL